MPSIDVNRHALFLIHQPLQTEENRASIYEIAIHLNSEITTEYLSISIIEFKLVLKLMRTKSRTRESRDCLKSTLTVVAPNKRVPLCCFPLLVYGHL